MMNFSQLLIVLSYFTVWVISDDLISLDPSYVSEMEKSMADTISDHLNDDHGEMHKMLRLINQLEERSKKHAQNILADPVGLYRAVKSLVDEWERYSTMLKSAKKQKSPIKPTERQLPKLKDIEDVLMALFRIQDTYKFDTTDIASGSIPGLNTSSNLNAKECYEIGMVAFNKTDYYHALSWLHEAGIRLEQEQSDAIRPIDILAPYAVALDEKGNMEHAVFTAAALFELLEQDKDGKKEILKRYPRIKDLADMGNKLKGISQEDLGEIKNERVVAKPEKQAPYELACIGNHSKVLHIDPKLKCFYERTRPFLKLAPAKAEYVQIKPLIITYRGIISDNEIEVLMSLVKGKMKRGRVEKHGRSSSYVSEERTSSTAWLTTKDHPLIEILRRRVGDYTGLYMGTAENLQLASYGIGGHISLHHDHATDVHDARRQKIINYNGQDVANGDRLATMMYYFATPEYGGATAFPFLMLTIPPSKNDALFWYNLEKSGKGIQHTVHGGCPVISGKKWVVNQWMNEVGQEFVRPCGLTEDA